MKRYALQMDLRETHTSVHIVQIIYVYGFSFDFIVFVCFFMNNYFDRSRHEPTTPIIIPDANIILEVSTDCDNFFSSSSIRLF